MRPFPQSKNMRRKSERHSYLSVRYLLLLLLFCTFVLVVPTFIRSWQLLLNWQQPQEYIPPPPPSQLQEDAAHFIQTFQNVVQDKVDQPSNTITAVDKKNALRHDLIAGGRQERQQITDDEDSITLTDDGIIPVCEIETAAYRPRPQDITKTKYTQVCEAEKVVAYIIRVLGELAGGGAPVSMFYGTMLKEHRNGTGSCVKYDFHDKDFDIIVLPEHFPLILGIVDDVTQKFGWKTLFLNKERLFMILGPANQKAFQIDIYSFHRNKPSKGLVFFPWDLVTVTIKDFLPFVKYKSTVTQDNNTTTSVKQNPQVYYHMPFNVPCLLAKIYGDDFMTPKTGRLSQAKTSSNIINNSINNGKAHYRNSTWCKELKLSATQQQELKNQMSGNWTSQ